MRNGRMMMNQREKLVNQSGDEWGVKRKKGRGAEKRMMAEATTDSVWEPSAPPLSLAPARQLTA